MAAVRKKKRAVKNLAHGRPPTIQRPKSISRKATRALINEHHLLEKRKAQAVAKGDRTAVAAADAEIAALGGLETYQQASLQGQRNDRGGDSSRVLMDWLKPVLPILGSSATGSLRMLEVGALSTTNDCSRSNMFDMERIDLNSQSPGILQQDFMKRPLPVDDTERFDIISLSLVLNFVPDAEGRGKMLLRTLEFLKRPVEDSSSRLREFLPSLFMVLPAPCVTNSRYMDEVHLETIMNALGYTKVRSKITQKLVYYLWTRESLTPEQIPIFKKAELRSGRSRNNFSIVLRGLSG
ncbi:putative methyltransferase-domain-containing protein [Biscogniauxia sp. FL1348]|nr:putative methyltransferase-domain-containing protein [Biscogniauxia sp. FL1348]